MLLNFLMSFCFIINLCFTSQEDTDKSWKVAALDFPQNSSLNYNAPAWMPPKNVGTNSITVPLKKEEDIIPLYRDEHTIICDSSKISSQQFLELRDKYPNLTMILTPKNLKFPVIFGAPGSGRIVVERPFNILLRDKSQKRLPPPYPLLPPPYTLPPSYESLTPSTDDKKL